MNIFNLFTRKYSSLLLLAGIFAFNSAWANTEIINQAQELLTAGNNQAAYDLLKKNELQNAGQPEYDFLLGKSALAVDQPTMAVFAFERCLIVKPNDNACQLGLARAHLSLTEVENAKEIINKSQFDQQSDQYKDLMDDMRRALLRETDTDDTRFNLWVQEGLGYDSNVNTANTLDSIYVPAYDQYMPLNRDTQRKESFFNQTMLGVNYSTSINDKWRFIADGLVRHKNNWRVHDYDAFVTDARVGVQRNHNGHRFSVRALGQYYNLGGRTLRTMVGLNTLYSYSVTETTEIGGFAQYSYIHYPHSNASNANRYTAGLNWSHQFNDGKAMAYGSIYGGRQEIANSRQIHKDYNNDHYNFDMAGIQLGSTWLVTPRTRLDLNATYQHRRFDKQEPWFKKHRKDNQISARLGLVYAVNRKVTLRPSYEFIKTNSTIGTRHYSRHIVSFNVRYAIF